MQYSFSTYFTGDMPYFIFFILVCSCKNLFVSHRGQDFINCGDENSPCHSIKYTVSSRALANDLIHIEKDRIPFIVKKTIDIRQNISLAGYKGSLIIKLENEGPVLQYLHGESATMTSISLTKLIFIGTGALRQVKGKYNHKLIIKISNCLFTNVSHAVVSSIVSSRNPCSDIEINIFNSSFHACLYVVHVIKNLSKVAINIHGSSVQGSSQLGKYQGIIIRSKTSLNAQVNIVESNFMYLRQCFVYSHRGQGTVNRRPVISISHSTFTKNSKGAVGIYSDSSVQVRNCQFLHNYGGPTYLQKKATTTFINCLFERNRGRKYGGAIRNDGNGTCIIKNCTFTVSLGQRAVVSLAFFL